MTLTDVSLFCNGAGNTECFKTDADSFGSFRSRGFAELDRYCAAECVSPGSVLKSDGLNALNY